MTCTLKTSSTLGHQDCTHSGFKPLCASMHHKKNNNCGKKKKHPIVTFDQKVSICRLVRKIVNGDGKESKMYWHCVEVYKFWMSDFQCLQSMIDSLQWENSVVVRTSL